MTCFSVPDPGLGNIYRLGQRFAQSSSSLFTVRTCNSCLVSGQQTHDRGTVTVLLTDIYWQSFLREKLLVGAVPLL